jgi:hypothetical protein
MTRRARLALSTVGDEAKKSEGSKPPPNGALKNRAERLCAENATSDPPDRREIVARLIEPWAWKHKDSGKSTRGVQAWIDSSLDAADRVLAALDGGAGE